MSSTDGGGRSIASFFAVARSRADGPWSARCECHVPTSNSVLPLARCRSLIAAFSPCVPSTKHEAERWLSGGASITSTTVITLSRALHIGLAYALYDRANADKIPIITPGYGRLEGAAGNFFPYEFPVVGNDWEQTAAIIDYVASKAGGYDKLKGIKIGLVYLDNAYGKTPFPVLDDLAKRYGFEWVGYPVAGSAMVEQSSVWLQIRRAKLDYVLLWGWGVMTPTAIREAGKINFPLDRLIGNWWSAAEPDVIPVGAAAKGYVGATFRMPGTEFGVYKDLKKYVYDVNKAKGPSSERGTILYNQGLFFGMLQVEGIRAAQAKFGNKPISGEQARWGLEHAALDEKRLKDLGFDGLVAPLELSCSDHAGRGKLRLIQWDGEHWNPISGWLSGKSDVSGPLLQASAEKLGKEMNLVARNCAAAD